MPRKKTAVAEPEPPAETEEEQFEREFPFVEESDEEEPEEEITERASVDTSTEDSGPPPHYLDKLLALHGIDPGIMHGIDSRKAWLTVQTRDMPAQAMPLGHLAPDALQTLQDLGYERHARFELRPEHNSADVRYFAAVLPDLPDLEDEERDDEPSSALVQIIRSQDERMTRLEAALTKMAEGNADPFAQIERALAFVERITESVGSMRGNDGDTEIIKTAIEQLIPRFLPAPKPE